MNLIIYFIILFLTYIGSIYFHELGHYIYFKRGLKKKVTFRYERGAIKCGVPDDYKSITDAEYFDLNASGVLLGLIPIFLVGMILESRWVLILLFPYLWGAMGDIVNMVEHARAVEWES